MRVRLQLRCRFGRLRAEFRVGLIQRELEGLELFLLYRPKHQIVDKGYQYLYGWLRIVTGGCTPEAGGWTTGAGGWTPGAGGGS